MIATYLVLAQIGVGIFFKPTGRPLARPHHRPHGADHHPPSRPMEQLANPDRHHEADPFPKTEISPRLIEARPCGVGP